MAKSAIKVIQEGDYIVKTIKETRIANMQYTFKEDTNGNKWVESEGPLSDGGNRNPSVKTIIIADSKQDNKGIRELINMLLIVSGMETISVSTK